MYPYQTLEECRLIVLQNLIGGMLLSIFSKDDPVTRLTDTDHKMMARMLLSESEAPDWYQRNFVAFYTEGDCEKADKVLKMGRTLATMVKNTDVMFMKDRLSVVR